MLPAVRRVGGAVRDELKRATPFEDGAFEVALAWAMAFGVDGWDLAVQGEALERFGAASPKPAGRPSRR